MVIKKQFYLQHRKCVRMCASVLVCACMHACIAMLYFVYVSPLLFVFGLMLINSCFLFLVCWNLVRGNIVYLESF